MQCHATTSRGTRCKRRAVPGSKFCAQHQLLGDGQAGTKEAGAKEPNAKEDVGRAGLHFEAISGPMSVYVLKPKSSGPKLLLFGDYHGSFQGECADAGSVRIYSPEFLRKLSAASESVVIVSEAFYEPEHMTKLMQSPQLLRSFIADLDNTPRPGPLDKFMFALLEPCLFKQHKQTVAAARKSSWLRQACPYPNLHVLWGDIRKIYLATGLVRGRFYWETLLVDVLTLMAPGHSQVAVEDLPNVLAVMNDGLQFAVDSSGVSASEIMQQVHQTVRGLAFGGAMFGSADGPMFAPQAHANHSLLWKQLRKIPKKQHDTWKQALTTYCERVEPMLSEDVKQPRFETAVDRFFEALGAGQVPRPNRETNDVAVVCGALLTDCYSLLRLRGKYPDADRAVFYMGQAHIKEIAKFHTEILRSHTLEFRRVNSPDREFRCLRLGPDVDL